MDLRVIKCDNCGNEEEWDGEKTPEGWKLMTDSEGEQVHLCSWECTQQYARGVAEEASMPMEERIRRNLKRFADIMTRSQIY